MSKLPPKDPLLVVLGATGTGKSQLAVDLATRFDGEIINGDAMQMYDGLPVITNKITIEEQQSIPHHLLGFIALDEEPWRVGLFKKRASQIIQEIRSRGRLPILVGGTHYYTQSLLFENSLVAEEDNDGIQKLVDASDHEILNRFPILEGSTEVMIERLREVDPVMADRWHPNERRKIRRSLEIFLTTGKKASEIYAEQKERKSIPKVSVLGEDSQRLTVSTKSTLLFWVHSDSEILKERLDGRVDKMVEMGLLDEVKSMDGVLKQQTDAGISVDLTRGIWVSIGWKEFVPYLNALKSVTSSPESLKKLYNLSIEQTKNATRQYAKRQVRWIRGKLMPALMSENALGNLYLVDASDIKQWYTSVAHPAIEITTDFLAGGIMTPPRELSIIAKQVLAPPEFVQAKDIGFHRECALCQVTTVVEQQWLDHLSSRRHRSLEKRRLKNALNGRSRRVDGLEPARDAD